MLDIKNFKQLVTNAPLFSIDLVIVNKQSKVLVGLRKNAPAKGYWFVPGGRVFKNESLEHAIERISISEIGCKLQHKEMQFLNLFEHFYSHSFFSSAISTHYINSTYAIKLENKSLNLQILQHDSYRWLTIDELEEVISVHPYSKIFIKDLNHWLQNDS